MSIRSFRDLEAWQRAMDLVVAVYALAARLPREERYGLAMQLRRAAISIPANISEGHARGTRGYLYFLSVALGSLAEVDTQLDLAGRLQMASARDLEALAEMTAELGRILHGLRRSLERRLASEHARRSSNSEP